MPIGGRRNWPTSQFEVRSRRHGDDGRHVRSFKIESLPPALAQRAGKVPGTRGQADVPPRPLEALGPSPSTECGRRAKDHLCEPYDERRKHSLAREIDPALAGLFLRHRPESLQGYAAQVVLRRLSMQKWELTYEIIGSAVAISALLVLLWHLGFVS